MRNRIAATVLLLTASLLVSALGVEALVRALEPQDLSGTWLEVSEPRGCRRNKAEGTSRHQSGARQVRYRFNDHHLRGGPVPAEGARILALGDSFTFGHLLREDDTYVRRLDARAEEESGSGVFRFLNP